MATTTSKLICALKSCKNKGDLHDQSRVEVKSFASQSRDDFIVNWKSDGQAAFHKECWAIVRRTAGTREKEMVAEASKTAEYFDSPDEIDRSARHIADLLKNACHAIAFTGW